MAKAKKVMCFTVSFTLADVFKPILSKDTDVLRFVLSDKQLGRGALITRDKDVLHAAGAEFEKGELPSFLEERLTGVSKNLYSRELRSVFVLSRYGRSRTPD